MNNTQEQFVNLVWEHNKTASDDFISDTLSVMRTLLYNSFQIYLLSEERDKPNAAHMIQEFEKYGDFFNRDIFLLIDRDEYERHLKEYSRMKHRTNIGTQKTRHEGLDFYNITYEEWDETLEYFNHECAYCGIRDSKLTYDHVHPFSKGGNFVLNNIIPACKTCNSSKNNNDVHDWYVERPFYDKSRMNRISQFIQRGELTWPN